MSTSVTDSAALSMGRAEWVAGRSAVPEPPAHGIKDAVAGVYKKKKKKAGRRDPQKMLSAKLIRFLNCSISSSVILKELLPPNLEKTKTFDIKIIQLPSDCHNNYAALTRFL